MIGLGKLSRSSSWYWFGGLIDRVRLLGNGLDQVRVTVSPARHIENRKPRQMTGAISWLRAISAKSSYVP